MAIRSKCDSPGSDKPPLVGMGSGPAGGYSGPCLVVCKTLLFGSPPAAHAVVGEENGMLLKARGT
jgi:hypothetical protein